MKKIINYINMLSKSQKITYLILILVFALVLSIGIPTLARYKNRSSLITTSVWDGSVATKYRSGTGLSNDPYIISNGAELAYFQQQLLTTDYGNTYFTLSSDIVLNKGTFTYDITDGIKYILNNQTYYVDDYTNKYYDNALQAGTEIGTLNMFNSLDGFKGTFNGNSYRIYGLYVTSEINEKLALFTDLEGDIKDLYVENSIVYGGTITAGIASTTNNASISNVLFNGEVIGKNNIAPNSITMVPTSPLINIQNTETTDYIDLTNDIPFTGSEIISTSITGNYVITGASDADTSVKINGQTVTNGSFEVDLGISILNSVPVVTTTTSSNNVTLTFSDLSYNITYKYGVAGGIIANSNNTVISNTINKSYVYGYCVSGGLAGVTTNAISINQSYNIGDINSTYVSGGLIGTIEKSSENITISKSYNTGDISSNNIGGLLGVITNNSGTITINNTFNTSTTNYSIGTIDNTIVNVTDSYYANNDLVINSGTINSGNFVSTSSTDLKTKSFVENTLLFGEFISYDDLETNTNNVWVYEEDRLPILFIDDISNPIANINVSVYSWDNLSYELNSVKLDSNITFSITAKDSLNPIKETYYYVSNSSSPLTSIEVSQISSWITYSDLEQIETEGFYIIYAKIVDYDDNITYLNTDLLILDLPGVKASIDLDSSSWSNLRSSLDSIYIDREKTLTVDASDDISGVSSIKYYITDEILDSAALDELSLSSWTNYSSGIVIDAVGKQIVYVQIVDSFDYVTYINTDYIIYDGYIEELIIGRNVASYLNADAYITNKSTITLNFSYSNLSASDLINHTHNLISNILLPIGTKITLLDNINNKVYEYRVIADVNNYNYDDSCDASDIDCIKQATYPLTLFKEIGTSTVTNYYTESSYYNDGEISEDFTVVVDLASTNIITNYTDVSLTMGLNDNSNANVRPTLYDAINKFNIYSTIENGSTNASLYLTSDYIGNAIDYKSSSVTNINLSSGINYKYKDVFKIIDTTYEDKTIGLSIKLVDSAGNKVDKKYLESMVFKIGENTYSPGSDSIIRINLNSGIDDVIKSLSVTTYENNSDLASGTYYLKISNYASDDGSNYSILGSDIVSIPVTVNNSNANIEYGFNVNMDDNNRIVNKTNSSINVIFNISQSGYIYVPNIRISLYKKSQLTAYDQSYQIVDLANYISNNLTLVGTNVYYVSTNPTEENNIFGLDLITANFENTGYKFVFELYDDTKKIGTIEKYFIVK